MFPKNWKILITGITSIHGWPVYKALSALLPASRLCGIRSPKMKQPAADNIHAACITDENAFKSIREKFQPTHIVHAAGVCDLDVCEERPEWAFELNVKGTECLAKLFGETCYFMYLSTDLVFSGKLPPAAGYDETAVPDPVSTAGRTFAWAEEKVIACHRYAIIRLGLPLGDSLTGDKGGYDWTASRFRRSLPVTLFHDEIRSCIPCGDIALYIPRLLSREVTGIFHLGGRQAQSLYEMGRTVVQRGGYDPSLLKGISILEEKNGPPRIANVTLNCAKAYKLLDGIP